ncbi:MAG TPA: chemotaxis response regulator protein-glutamate methylesterase [Candidatus Binatia bacterium]|nr:chemotaxis response regulator protein-glutamate methylesterase [Candidatus Binatia bacterium]
MRRIRVLIVDDAVVARRVVTEALASDAAIEVVGTAPNGRVALARLAELHPDLVILDVEMPELDGLATLVELRRAHPRLPVVMFSSLTERGAAATLEALARGATDYVTKPPAAGGVSAALARVREELIPKIRALCAAAAERPAAPAARPGLPRPAAAGADRRVEVLAIGASTGGPNALAAVLPQLPPTFPVPIVVVQHMPPLFTRLLAERLDAKSAMRVREAAPGELLAAGCVEVAPGGYHMEVVRERAGVRIRTHEGPPENSCRPSVDVLLRSVAEVYGRHALAVVLTGMGRDGLQGCLRVAAAGGQILVQDEATSVVWGMPGAVAGAGLADRVLPLGEIAHEIVRRILVNRGPADAAGLSRR